MADEVEQAETRETSNLPIMAETCLKWPGGKTSNRIINLRNRQEVAVMVKVMAKGLKGGATFTVVPYYNTPPSA